jgi:hypothetical protein
MLELHPSYRKQMKDNEIYKKILNWSEEAGEDFVDYFDSDINIYNFMFWCYGRGFLNKNKFNLWEKAIEEKDIFAKMATSIISGSEEYSIFDEDSWEDGYMMLADFISSSDTYIKRFNSFLEDYDNA